jgi:hypothetical protein
MRAFHLSHRRTASDIGKRSVSGAHQYPAKYQTYTNRPDGACSMLLLVPRASVGIGILRRKASVAESVCLCLALSAWRL